MNLKTYEYNIIRFDLYINDKSIFFKKINKNLKSNIKILKKQIFLRNFYN